MALKYFALLGLGGRGRRFRGCRFPLPSLGGALGWIRWRDDEWAAGGKLPTPSFESDADWSAERPAELTERWLDLAAEAGRFVVEIGHPGGWPSEEDAAAAVADVVLGLFSFLGPFLDLEWPVVDLEPEWIDRGEVSIQALIARADQLPWLPYEWTTKLRECSYFDERNIALFLSRAGPALADGDGMSRGVAPAILYHRLSALDFGFLPDDVRAAVDDPAAGPRTPLQRAKAERAFLDAYKGIEAVLGGRLPADDRQIRSKLGRRGIEPSRDPGPPDGTGRALWERIARLRDIRDGRSAHGGGPGQRHMPYRDLVEAQWVVGHLIHEVIGRSSSLADSPARNDGPGRE